MNLFWLEQTEADVPVENNWLSAGETLRLSALRFPKRRGDWRLGRWTAKRAVAAHLSFAHPGALSAIEIRAAASGAPEVFLNGEPAGIAISLSHRAGTAVCAVMPSLAAMGCDLEEIEPRDDNFFQDYFTAEEQAWVAREPAVDRPWISTLIWSAKESALKALRVGLRADTRAVAVTLLDSVPQRGNEEECSTDPLLMARNRWFPLRVDSEDGAVFPGWWQRTEQFVYTVVSDPPPDMPVLLKVRQSTIGG